MPEKTSSTERKFPCQQCGASLKFTPGTNHLSCPYCGGENEIAEAEDAVGEQDYYAQLQTYSEKQDTYTVHTAKCSSCAAETTLPANVTSAECPFCETTLVAETHAEQRIKPQALLPFQVKREEARECFKKWVNGLWFAPNALKKFVRLEGKLKGVYLPHWTYDADAVTHYTGQRGEHYYVNESYTTTDSEGKSVRKTRRVRKTRWYSASGVVNNSFDDILVVASQSLPEKYIDKLEPWDLEESVAHEESYLSGFITESYTVDLQQGFTRAQEKMKPQIERRIKRDIGGDEQRISSYQSNYPKVTFKHILLPVWINAYRYRDELYRFLVNARTGEVQGERPWSWVKITLAALAGVAVVGGIIWYRVRG